MVRKFGRRSSQTSTEDDVRSSLDLLDSVIGEFDDGLLSGAESDYNLLDQRKHVRESPARSDGSAPKDRVEPVISDKKRLISDKIDHIFHEASQEIAEERFRRRRSPTRRVNDPLPIPPQPAPPPPPPPPMPMLGGGEVIVYEDYDHNQSGRSSSITTNVKAQIHSLEARGRDVQQMKRYNNNQVTGAKDKSRSKSENRGFSYLERPTPTSSEMPPPMPEKTKIHLKPRTQPVAGSTVAGGSFDRGSSTSAKNGLPINRAPSSQDKIKMSHRTQRNESTTTRIVLNGREFIEDPPRRSKSPVPVSKRFGKRKEGSNGRRGQNHMSPESSVGRQSAQNPYESVQGRASQGGSSSNGSRRDSSEKDHPRTRVKGSRASNFESSRLQNRRSRSMGALEAEEHREFRGSTSRLHDPRPQSPPRKGDHQSGGGGGRITFMEEPKISHSNASRDRRGRNRRRDEAKRSGSRGRSLERGMLRPTSPSNQFPPDPMEQFLPRFPYPGKMPTRQKSMIDLRDPHWEQQQRLLKQHEQHLAFLQHQRRFGAPHNGPPPNLMRSATEHDIKIRNRRSIATDHPGIEDVPPLMRRQMMMQGAMAAQNQFLPNERLSRSNSKLALHQADPAEHAILRQLNLDAQREFLLNRGFSPSHPIISGEIAIHPELQGRLPFDVPSRTIPLRPEDYQRFKPELWLQANNPNVVPFQDMAVIQGELELRRRRELHRQSSTRTGGESESQSFQSLPWEDIILNNPSLESNLSRTHPGKSEKKAEKIPPNMTSFAKDRREDERKKKEKTSWFSSKGTKEPDHSKSGAVKLNGHWFMREKQDHQSMPYIAENGVEEEGPEEGLSRTGTHRSSFGIILRDKFQKNPNVYFPNTDSKRSKSQGKEGDTAECSDTDTLIHNMSEGSYEKDESHSLSGSGSGASSHSLSKGSSATSSLSPHNSMEGSPRMFSKDTPSPVLFPNQITSSQPSVTLGKKTIRNYTPQTSTTMLRELETKRSKSRPRLEDELDESKTSVEKMIDDFHRNLPPPSVRGPPVPSHQGSEGFQEFGEIPRQLETSNPGRPETCPASGLSSKRTSKHGTLNSQISNWSVASSSASFDYQPAGDDSTTSSRRRSPQNQLPALREVEHAASRGSSRGERFPPEGASVESPSPTNLAQFEEDNARSGQLRKPKIVAGEDLSDLLEPKTDEEDDFSNLRKLISEGRLTGLNEKPPSFVPPTPPTTSKPKKVPSNVGKAGASPRRNKQPAPKPSAQTRSKSQPPSRHLEKQPSRKTKEAPKPPRKSLDSNLNAEDSDSVEDLTNMDQRRQQNGTNIARSPSQHESKTNYELRREENNHMAQLIADSTEKKFNFNPFKGFMKKKHYSFDFN